MTAAEPVSAECEVVGWILSHALFMIWPFTPKDQNDKAQGNFRQQEAVC